MHTAVIDASVVIDLLLSPAFAAEVGAQIGNPDLIAPPHLLLESLHTLRRMERLGTRRQHEIADALAELGDMPVDRKPIDHLSAEIWRRRHTLTPYDAAYAALAEEWGCPLLTRDAKLARAADLGCDAIVL